MDTTNKQTLHLVTLAKSGDNLAIEKLYEIYSERILRIVRLRMGSKLRSKMQSMDIVQEALFSSFRDMKNFVYKNEGDFLRWLSTIAENKIRDHLRKLGTGRRDISKEIPLDDHGQSKSTTYWQKIEPVNPITPTKIITEKEEWDKLENAMQTLKPEYREVIRLTKIEGLSQREVGEQLGKTPDAVRMLLGRALNALSKAYE